MAIYSWVAKFPTYYHITTNAPSGLKPEEVLEKIKTGDIEFDATSYDGWTPSDFMDTCHSEENQELLMKMTEEDEE